MLTAALVGIGAEPQEFAKKLNSMQIPGVKLEITEKIDKNVVGLHSNVIINEHFEEECSPSGATIEEIECQMAENEHNHTENEHNHAENHHHHSDCRHLDEIFSIIDSINAAEKVKKDAKAVYSILADAESEAHGVPVAAIHFHEVGMLDAIADITAVCYLFNELAADKIVCSPVNLGNGKVKCSHGILDVPVPATAILMRDLKIPHYKDESGIMKELCTPTGAALIGYFADEYLEFGEFFANAKTENGENFANAARVGHGFGNRVFESVPNCVTAYLVEE